MEKVKFYSTSDWSCGYNLEKLYKVLKEYDSCRESYEINQIIEFFNIIQYIENDCFLQKWSKEDIKFIKSKLPELKKTIGKFCNGINDKNIVDIFSSIKKENFYYEDFFSIIEKYNVYEKITDKKIEKLLKKDFVIHLILQNKKIVNKYGNTIKKNLIKNPENALILLDKYEIEEREKRIYLPKELSKEEKEQLLIDYINTKEANLNYLRVIENIQNCKDGLEISDKTRLLTKKKIKEQTKDFFKGNSGIKMETLVQFCHERQAEEVVIDADGRNIKCTYDLNWIKDNQDYPTLLNNFIYLFSYVDMQMRISLISKESNLGLFEKHIFINSRKSYKKGMVFDRFSLLSDLQIMGYYDRLKEISIRLEDIIEWFFKEYLLSEFKIENFKIEAPSENATTLEKCRMILSEMDHILKEYQLIVEDGKIDHELMEISSNPILFGNVKSLVEKKYVYESSNEYKIIAHYFFSDQCMLHYVKRINKSYKSFFNLIRNEKINKEDYKGYAENEINYLLTNDYIMEDKEGYLKINKKSTIIIFKDLYQNNVINYWKYPKKTRIVIDELVSENILSIGSSLLSKPEIDYFNYYLNKSEFNNGLDLRNKYIHGTQPSSDNAQEQHKYNYMVFLKLFILLIIKINDDLCTFYSKEYQEENE